MHNQKILKQFETCTSKVKVGLLENDEIVVEDHIGNFTIVDGSHMAGAFIARLFRLQACEIKRLRAWQREARRQRANAENVDKVATIVDTEVMKSRSRTTKKRKIDPTRCVHYCPRGTPAGELHRLCARLGSV